MRALLLAWLQVRRLPLPLLLASAAGWGLLWRDGSGLSLSAFCLSVASPVGDLAVRIIAAFTSAPPSTLLRDALTMLLAMMPPLLATPLLHLWRRSLTRRRAQAIALFLLAYLAVWLPACLLLRLLALALESLPDTDRLAVPLPALLVALAWQSTPLKQACLNRCHSQPPLAAFGWRADRDALVYGVDHGVWCVGTCWALMLIPLAAGTATHGAWMFAVMWIALLERIRAPAHVAWGAAWPRLRHAPRPALQRDCARLSATGGHRTFRAGNDGAGLSGRQR
ncbi:DUF2182 domain-containing protein [Ralstonia solanacearum]|uniref:DUF2182 domain-containing protein n=1 Tax=Ralstonia solanacearum TaxID=305 RepID=UPI0001816978|nr:DUF2182 domain-containing protein [Ralstonia solanacearum]MDC6180582.1 DUF2182 domain-containing protein [Ralstonia solanacearum]MDC6213223.1 DUF2182 domain-containing protein [Ralstonia solanacearum]MDC6242179.1 DUF2182 domain-containing protein [Ralstonia solanacearum]MDD7803808.1 DUF2182 domain-containing protein [Ralstonia solanacearum]